MNVPMVFLGSSLALAGGALVGGRRAIQHARSVGTLLASIDHRLAHELSKYATSLEIQDAHDTAIWQRVGGIVGIICLIRQARLWRNLVRRIRERDPQRFELEGISINKHYGALWFAVVLAIIETGFRRICPALPKGNGRVCVSLFTEIAATAELVILAVDSDHPCEVP